MSYELARQHEVWDCPFCNENTISVIHFPKSVTVKRSKTASLSGSKGFMSIVMCILFRVDASSAARLRKKLRRNCKRSECCDLRDEFLGKFV